MIDDRSEELAVVHSEINNCTKCGLHKTRKKAVPGEGPIDSKIMFVGEGPGQNEDEQGKPFVGAAGKLLTELLESIGLARPQIFITNIVKCRPPNNRAPGKNEIETCNPYLENQIRLVNPRIICLLGTPAITTMLGQQFSASKDHGKPTVKGTLTILPMYHPAAVLYDATLKEVLASDFRILKKLAEQISSTKTVRGQESSMSPDTLEKWA
ncbi:MAG TPA: uracil-DNA glycosylase [Candidatus Dormibacteraeota bacterium]|jgi:DNA polymerase|nr:uracil-DNA glycosylase [Candidatus Dormibacteraeota bacterium]